MTDTILNDFADPLPSFLQYSRLGLIDARHANPVVSATRMLAGNPIAEEIRELIAKPYRQPRD